MRNKKYAIGFLILLLIAYLIYVYFLSLPKYNRLKSDFIIGTCYSYDFTPGTSYKNSPPAIYYRYKVDGIEYKGHTQLEKISATDLQSNLLFKTFPVAIDTKDYSNSAALIEPNKFDDFKIKFPDSLNWVLPYIKN